MDRGDAVGMVEAQKQYSIIRDKVDIITKMIIKPGVAIRMAIIRMLWLAGTCGNGKYIMKFLKVK